MSTLKDELREIVGKVWFDGNNHQYIQSYVDKDTADQAVTSILKAVRARVPEKSRLTEMFDPSYDCYIEDQKKARNECIDELTEKLK